MNYGICRFCLEVLKDSNFEPVHEIIKEIAEVLVLKLNLSISKEPRACHSCIKKLETLFEFKSTCLYTEDYIYPFGSSAGGTKLDLCLIYAKKHKISDLREISTNQKVCRFCMQLIIKDDYAGSLKDIEQDVFLGSMLRRYFPEIEFGIIKDPVYCSACFDILQNYFTFAVDCASVEEKIQQYCNIEGTNSQRYVSLHDVLQLMSTTQSEDAVSKKAIKLGDSLIKTESENCILMQVENFSGNIKNEEIEIKHEPSEDQSFEETVPLPPSRKKKQKYGKLKRKTSKCLQKCIIKLPPREKALHKCKLCPYSTNYRYRIEKHMRTHGKSKQSSDETNYKIHDVSPKDPPKVLLYKCNNCGYQTRFKYLLRRHNNIVHNKGIGGVKVYRCENCDYTTKYSTSFARHVTVHMPRSKLTMYKCDHCEYESKYRGTVQKHIRNEHTDM